MNRFERVVQILDNAIGGPDNGIGGPHGAFWQGLTRDQFVAMTVVGAQLLTVGQGKASNLVRSLKGEAPFGLDLPTPPPGAEVRRRHRISQLGNMVVSPSSFGCPKTILS